jgi:histidine decarboxylase
MKGAVDDVVRIREILTDLKMDKCYIHCDAAFFGMILPFLPEIESQPFDFRMGIDSIAISGHKLIGTPFPCGVILTKRSHVEKIGHAIEYVGIRDTTISGSRNGVSPLLLWVELDNALEGKFEKLIQDCMEKASYAINKFNAVGIKAWRNTNSIIVIFTRPSEKTIKRWQLATEGNISHMITLDHVTHQVIDLIVKQVAADLKHKRKKRAR